MPLIDYCQFDMPSAWTQPVADRVQFDQLGRREFITLLGSAAAWPLPARAQQEVYRIGVLVISGPELMGQYREALHDLGYIDGKNIEYVLRSAAGQVNRLPALAAELVDSKVNIIVASLTPAVLAAKNATRDIPIVMAPAGDPVGMKIVESYARPGGNITGMSGIAVELGAKNLELIREIFPAAQRLAVLHNAADPLAKSRLEQIQHAGKLTSFDVWPVVVHSNNEVPNAFAAMARERPDVVLVPGSLPVQPMLDLALKERLPATATHKSIVHAGALAAYSVSFAELGREIAHYVDRILKGAKPADLPVQAPTKYELVINLKTARALGLDLPATLLARADEVIE